MPNKSRPFYITNATADVSAVRRETFQGVEHLVVPIVALVEGVLHPGNSQHNELALASEFGKFPAGWNGRPVTLDHPVRNGSNVSASQSPSVFEEETLGFLFNTKLDDNKLKTEAWINMDSVKAAGEKVEKEIARLESGEPVEVSTGLFVELEDRSGRYNSESYEGIWRNAVPDHLAILPAGTIGACSVADGCGAPRLNCGGDQTCSCGRSNDMPKGKKKDDPIEEPTGNTEGNDNPQLQDPPKESEDDNVSLERVSFLKGIKEKFAGVFRLHKKADAELSDMDTRQAIAAALKVEDSEKWYDIVAVFNSNFVYAPSWDGTLYQRDFSISSEGTVHLGSDKTRVRPETTFVPVNLMEDVKMNKQALVDSLITNSAIKWEESDREFLTSLSEDQLQKMQPAAASAEPPKETKANTTVSEPAPAVNSKPVTAEEFIAQAPTEMQEMLNEGLRMQRDRKNKLVEELKANKRNSFGEEELKAMSLPMLEKLSKLGDLPSYEGRQGGTIVANSADNAVPDAPVMFPLKSV